MLVVSEVLTTIEPSGLTATPSGSTPTGNSLTTLRVAMSIAVKSASFSLATNTYLSIPAHPQLLGIGARRQFTDLLQGLCVDDRNRIVVAKGDEHQRVVLAQRDAARSLASLDGVRDFELVEIDDRYRVALLVGDIGGRRVDWVRKSAKARQNGERSGAVRNTFH